jgi:FkbM family methyltransferase
MSLATAPSVARLTKFLNRVGLEGINHLGKSIVRRSSGNVLEVRADDLLIQGPVDSWNVLAQIRSRTFEPFEVQLFKESLEPGMTVLDIGANIGYYTLLAATIVGPGGRVYAFEPDPRTVKSLVANVKANRLSNVTVIPKVASDSKQLLEFQQSRIATYSGLHSSMPEDSIVGTALVESIAVDDVLDGASVDVIKCDVEGEEPAVLRGMQRTLRKSPNLRLLVEFNPMALRSAGADPSSFLDELTRLFDHVEVIDERKRALTRLEPTELGRLANLYCRRPRQA